MTDNQFKGMMSSEKMDWETPQDFFDKLNAEFHFNLDPCASEENHKCSSYFTKEIDGLKRDWGAKRVLQSTIRQRAC